MFIYSITEAPYVAGIAGLERLPTVKYVRFPEAFLAALDLMCMLVAMVMSIFMSMLMPAFRGQHRFNGDTMFINH